MKRVISGPTRGFLVIVCVSVTVIVDFVFVKYLSKFVMQDGPLTRDCRIAVGVEYVDVGDEDVDVSNEIGVEVGNEVGVAVGVDVDE